MQPNPTEQRFWAKVAISSEADCWLWTGGKTQDGYGLFKFIRDQSNWLAHRVAYTLRRGEIPDGLTLDHICRNRACVNPAHLDPVSLRENMLRGEGLAAQNARKTHCLRGHAFTPENTYRAPSRPWRICRACRGWSARRVSA